MNTSNVRHQELYKGRTPPWKDTYRKGFNMTSRSVNRVIPKRCFERLRGSRERLQNRLRNVDSSIVDDQDSSSFVKDLMTEEFKSLQKEQNLGEDNELFALDDVDEMLSLFEDIQRELQKEEERLIDEYEQYQHSLVHEEDALSAAIQALSTDEVICPLCQIHALMLNKGVIFCPCGLRIDTEQYCISLANVKQQLHEGLSLHSSSCIKAPAFSVVDGLGITNLLITCQVCDFMFVVV